MKRGEIYYIESTYRETGSEQRGGRPAVIVSNDKNNENSEVVEVVYMTTKPKNGCGLYKSQKGDQANERRTAEQ